VLRRSTGEADVSLLDRGTETVTVYPEEVCTDTDGNTATRPSKVGVVARAVVQPISSTENADGGFNTESRYRLRLINYPNILGAQSKIEWRGKRYSIVGDGMIYNGSRRTAHVDYVMVRR
jgi:hypothetical protein